MDNPVLEPSQEISLVVEAPDKPLKKKLEIALKYIIGSAVITSSLVTILVALIPSLEQIRPEITILLTAAINILLVVITD